MARAFLCGLWVVVYLFHYKDRSKFFLICALKNLGLSNLLN